MSNALQGAEGAPYEIDIEGEGRIIVTGTPEFVFKCSNALQGIVQQAMQKGFQEGTARLHFRSTAPAPESPDSNSDHGGQ
jgi:hypothetical protein